MPAVKPSPHRDRSRGIVPVVHHVTNWRKSDGGRKSKRTRIEQEGVMQEARDGEAWATDHGEIDADSDAITINQVYFV